MKLHVVNPIIGKLFWELMGYRDIKEWPGSHHLHTSLCFWRELLYNMWIRMCTVVCTYTPDTLMRCCMSHVLKYLWRNSVESLLHRFA
jgi:hypothetical protein